MRGVRRWIDVPEQVGAGFVAEKFADGWHASHAVSSSSNEVKSVYSPLLYLSVKVCDLICEHLIGRSYSLVLSIDPPRCDMLIVKSVAPICLTHVERCRQPSSLFLRILPLALHTCSSSNRSVGVVQNPKRNPDP